MGGIGTADVGKVIAVDPEKRQVTILMEGRTGYKYFYNPSTGKVSTTEYPIGSLVRFYIANSGRVESIHPIIFQD